MKITDIKKLSLALLTGSAAISLAVPAYADGTPECNDSRLGKYGVRHQFHHRTGARSNSSRQWRNRHRDRRSGHWRR